MHLVYATRRVVCEHCGGIHVELLSWVAGKRQFTRALMVTLATWAWVLTWKQVAGLFCCSWSTVATAVDEAVVYGLEHRDLTNVTHIGIDEISRKRGHVYVTNVYDLNSRRLLWSGEGCAKKTLEGFFDWGDLAKNTRNGSKGYAVTCGSLTLMLSRQERPTRFWCSTSSTLCSTSQKRSTKFIGTRFGKRAKPTSS